MKPENAQLARISHLNRHQETGLVIEDVLRRKGEKFPFLLSFNKKNYTGPFRTLPYFAEKSGLLVARVVPFLTSQNICDIFCYHASEGHKERLRREVVQNLTDNGVVELVDIWAETGRDIGEIYEERLAEMQRLQPFLDRSLKDCYERAVGTHGGGSPDISKFCQDVAKTFLQAAGLAQSNIVDGYLPIRRILTDEIKAGLERAERARPHKGGLVRRPHHVRELSSSDARAQEAAAYMLRETQYPIQPGLPRCGIPISDKAIGGPKEPERG